MKSVRMMIFTVALLAALAVTPADDPEEDESEEMEMNL